MGGHGYFLLIPPLIVVLFAVGFAAIARFDPSAPGARRFAIAYLSGGVALAGDFLLADNIELLGGYPINIPWIASGALYAWAVFGRFGVRTSLAVCIGVPAAQFVAYTVFVIQDDLLARVAVMNLGGTITLFAPVPMCWPHAKRPLERLVLILIGFGALQYALRTGVLLPIEGSTLTAENYADSLIVRTTLFFTVVLGATIALILMFDHALMIVERLRRQANTDPLTGLLNRRGLDNLIELRAASSGDRPTAVIVMNVDRFKSINDRYGRDVGDRVLRELAQVLLEQTEGNEAVARFGGEEFVIVSWGTTRDAILTRAEMLRLLVRSWKVGSIGGRSLTASFGVAEWVPGRPLAFAIENAEKALQRAKERGRDRAARYDEVPGGSAIQPA